ncbi:2Fe-2S iron-sulfur cluster binding domain-containing protein [Sphingomonas sp. CGMCC 1.13654]|uniref:2Fe-2S iron-sulfur cluster binding domain-containing protein n=1 Tax=Sphingomonas chungangi TaxID=2683589 RepID=A0A838L576_9SPHN|nr:2Fe-2S iron-sulfur cluster-binding protein [Sphingomonas chungangi]MBA2933845.1 2Fe-2S iron-sulfur cluster binding domain-containing protein [Sphingomonas chungangi]MVW55175.1 2Fe-2S iron-sulfur cluster binding domain-containing protein [Sphingomonas chungangi]
MPKVTYIEAGGEVHDVEVATGLSVMEGARSNGIPGIEADCGGVCACATCHVFVDPDWYAATGGPNENEHDMLDCATDPGPTSRLSCQIAMTGALDGLVVRLPATQR